MTEWKVSHNMDFFQVWRQTRPLEPGEPMRSGIRECRARFDTKEEAQRYADELNRKNSKNNILHFKER